MGLRVGRGAGYARGDDRRSGASDRVTVLTMGQHGDPTLRCSLHDRGETSQAGVGSGEEDFDGLASQRCKVADFFEDRRRRLIHHRVQHIVRHGQIVGDGFVAGQGCSQRAPGHLMGHVGHRRDAPGQRRPCAPLEVVGTFRPARRWIHERCQVDVRIDTPRNDEPAGRLDVAGALEAGADPGDRVACDTDVGPL